MSALQTLYVLIPLVLTTAVVFRATREVDEVAKTLMNAVLGSIIAV